MVLFTYSGCAGPKANTPSESKSGEVTRTSNAPRAIQLNCTTPQDIADDQHVKVEINGPLTIVDQHNGTWTATGALNFKVDDYRDLNLPAAHTVFTNKQVQGRFKNDTLPNNSLQLTGDLDTKRSVSDKVHLLGIRIVLSSSESESSNVFSYLNINRVGAVTAPSVSDGVILFNCRKSKLIY